MLADDCREQLLFVASLMLWPPNRWAVIQGPYWTELARRARLHDGPLPDDVERLGKLIRDWQEALPPRIAHLQDFVPPPDDGTVRFWFEGNSFRYFYGSGLEAPHDRLTYFDQFHRPLKEHYRSKYGADPAKYLTLALEVQDHILERLAPRLAQAQGAETQLGRIELPPQEFRDAVANAVRISLDELDRWLGGWSSRERDTFLCQLVADVQPDDAAIEWPADLWEKGLWPSYWGLRSDDAVLFVLPRTINETLLGRFGVMYRSLLADGLEQYPAHYELDSRIEQICRRELGGSIQVQVWPQQADAPQRWLDLVVPISASEVLLFVLFGPGLAVSDAQEALDVLEKAAAAARGGTGGDSSWVHCVALYADPGLDGLMEVSLPRTESRTSYKIMGCWDLLGLVESADSWDEIARYLRVEWELRHQVGELISMNPLDPYPMFRSRQAFSLGGKRWNGVLVHPGDWTELRHRLLHEFWSLGPFQLTSAEHPRTWRCDEKLGTRAYGVVRRDGRHPAVVVRTSEHDIWVTSPPPREFEEREAILVSLVIETLYYDLDELGPGLDSFLNDVLPPALRVRLDAMPASWARRSDVGKSLNSAAANMSGESTQWLARVDDGTLHGVVLLDVDRLSELYEAEGNGAERQVLMAALRGIGYAFRRHEGTYQATQLVNAHVPPGDKRFSMFSAALPVEEPPAWVSPIDIGPGSRAQARQQVARIIGERGWAPGAYDGKSATGILNAITSALWSDLVGVIGAYPTALLLEAVITQCERSLYERFREVRQHAHARGHRIEYDPVERVSRETNKAIGFQRACRLTAEAALACYPGGGDRAPSARELEEILAAAEQLDVLVQASDAIHYRTIAASVTITDELFLADWEFVDLTRAGYSLRRAAHALGIGVSQEIDRLMFPSTEVWLEELDDTFLQDLGFTLTELSLVGSALGSLVQVLGVPAEWCYEIQAHHLVATVAQRAEIPPDRVQRALEFLLLTPDQMKGWDPSDWREMRKRPARLAVRPIPVLPSGEGMRCFIGPFLVYQAMNVLLGSAAHGTWPAEIPGSKRVAGTLEARRKKLSDRMERVGAEVCGRHYPSVHRRIDLHQRFPRAGFPSDLGEHDVLAISAEKRRVVVLEAKHRAPAFVPKDEARLRNRLGRDVQKHSRRVGYLRGNLQKVLSALAPDAAAVADWHVSDAVVCSDLIVASIGEQVAPGVRFLTHEELEEWFRQDAAS